MASTDSFGPLWMGISWSLAIEEQFYLLLPLTIRRLSCRGIAAMAVAAIVGAPAIRLFLWWMDASAMSRYVLLPCRADALGYGVLIALACRNVRVWEWLVSHRRNLQWLLLILGCGFVYLHYSPRGMNVAGFSWIAAFYAALLLLVLVSPGRMEASWFRNWALVKLGTVAYAVYLFHQGVNALLHFAFFGRLPQVHDRPSVLVTVLSVAAVLVLAGLSWRLLEKPLIRYGQSAHRYD